MKLDEKIKNKYLYNAENNILKTIYYFFQRFKLVKRNYTVTGVDLLLDRFFKSIKVINGVYIDVGCNHPFFNSNTYMLYRNGWSGINIDLDFNFVDMFNNFRPGDFNKQLAVASKSGETDFYFYHNKSAINTLSQEMHTARGNNSKEVKKIQTQTLNSIIESSPYAYKNINLLTVDVEGFEMEVLKGFDLKKYCPDIIILEYLDTSMKKYEFYNHNIDNLIKSDLFNFMVKNEYTFVNWIDSDLVFVNNKIRNE